MLRLDNVSKRYIASQGAVNALDDVSLEIASGEFVVLTGPSGCGKTTLLMTIAGMLRPTCGKVVFGETDLYAMSIGRRAAFRAENVGFVFQMFHLVPYLNIAENVRLPAGLAKQNNSARRAAQLLEHFGLSERALHKPSQLSAGEKQRAAIARAMFNDPKLILADEPTGNLDPDNARRVLEHLSEYHRAGGTVVMVTHGNDARRHATRIIDLQSGRITHP